MPSSGHLARGIRMPLALFVALVALLSLGAASAFAAGTVISDGTTVTYTGDGGVNNLTVSDGGGTWNFTETGIASGGAPCVDGGDTVTCPKTPAISISLLGGADQTTFTNVGDNESVTVSQDGGADGDTLRGTQGGTLNTSGSGGADIMGSFTGTGGATATLDGGPDNDTYNGAASGFIFTSQRTIMVNSDGGDTFNPGNGYEEVTYAATAGPVFISLDGGFNDGRAGEGDGVGQVDHVVGSNAGDTINGSEGDDGFPDVFFLRSDISRGGFGSSAYGLAGGGGDDTINGNGGDDQLSGDDGNDLVNGGSGDDSMAGGLGNDTINGNDGDDNANGDAGDDTISGGAGDDQTLAGDDGNDAINGNDGSDDLDGGPGADTLSGGADFDSASIDAFVVGTGDPSDATVTLDDQANDGRAGEGDNYRADIEDLSVGGGGGRVFITGSPSFNVISGGVNGDTIDGAAGSDSIRSASGDDTVNSRDGANDRIDCGPGNDTANVDQFDEVTNCEAVNRATVAAANANRPPSVAFAAPAPNALLNPAGSPVTVNASDDVAVARVVLMDEDRVVGTDSTSPYTFNYVATGADVGRNTLVATAIDTSEQAGTAVRVVRADRFRPSIRGRVAPARDRSAPYRFRVTGGITLPRTVTRAQGCREGVVSVQFKRGRRTISTRRVNIRRTCGFSSTTTFRNSRRLGNGRLKMTVRFLGNDVLKPRTARTVRLRAG